MRYRVAVAGLGIGQQHIRHWRELQEQFELAAICDSDPNRLARAIDKYQVPGFASFDEILNADVDIVDICTPPFLHAEMAQTAMRSGRHVVCEKPLVNSLAEADELIALEEESGCILMPISQYRFAAGIQRLKHLVELNLTGAPYAASVETHWHRDGEYYAAPWRGRWATERGGVLLGHALHIHDLLCFILGEVETAYAEVATRVNPIETEDCAAASLKMRCGALVSSSSTLGSGQEISRMRFCFENFSVESCLSPYDPGQEPWHYAFTDTRVESRVRAALEAFEPPASGYTSQFEGLYAALLNGASPPVTTQDARRGLELVTALYSSSQSGQREQLPIHSAHPGYEDWRIPILGAPSS
jgi:predicted dehydrogenase